MVTGFPTSNLPSNGSGNAIPSSSGTNSSTGSDILSSVLREVTWRGVSFPCVSFKESGGQDLAVHKYPNLDGARVEPTGREPSKFSLRAVLTDNVYPGQNETWAQGSLYSTVFQKLLNYFYNDANLQAGLLQHPDKQQPITCRVVSWDYEYVGSGPRDGVFLDIELIETVETAITTTNTIVSIFNTSVSGGLDNPPLAPPNLNLGQFLQLLSTVIKQVVSYPNNALDALNSQLAIINSSTQSIAASLITAVPQTIQNSNSVLNQTKNSFINGSVMNSYSLVSGSNFETGNTFSAPGTSSVVGNTSLSVNPQSLQQVYQAAFAINNTTSGHALIFLQKVQKMISALLVYYRSLNNITVAQTILQLDLLLGQIQQTIALISSNTLGSVVQQYTVPQNISLLSLSSYLNQDLNTFLGLNPFITKSYYVSQGTTVNYQQG